MNESLFNLKTLPGKIARGKPACVFIAVMLAASVALIAFGTAASSEHRDLPRKAVSFLETRSDSKAAREMLEFLQNASDLSITGEDEGILIFTGTIERQSLFACEALRSFLDYKILGFYDAFTPTERAIALQSAGSLNFKIYIEPDGRPLQLTAKGAKAAKVMQKAGKQILKFTAQKGAISAYEYRLMKDELDTDPAEISIILPVEY